jgi:nitroreductase
MNDVLKMIYARRAVRKYKPVAVDKVLINELIGAGRMAPSGMNLQPWKFYIVTDEDLINKMDEQICIVAKDIYKMPEMIQFLRTKDPIFHEAPVVIFVTGPRQNEWAALDIGMCVQNIMLAATSLGLATCPIGLGKFIERTSMYRQLGIPYTEQVFISLTLGYADENPPPPKRKDDTVSYVRAGVLAKI